MSSHVFEARLLPATVQKHTWRDTRQPSGVLRRMPMLPPKPLRSKLVLSRGSRLSVTAGREAKLKAERRRQRAEEANPSAETLAKKAQTDAEITDKAQKAAKLAEAAMQKAKQAKAAAAATQPPPPVAVDPPKPKARPGPTPEQIKEKEELDAAYSESSKQLVIAVVGFLVVIGLFYSSGALLTTAIVDLFFPALYNTGS